MIVLLNLFFQLIARRYEKTSTVFTSNKDLLPVERGLCRRHHCFHHPGSRSASLHRDQHQGRVLPSERTQGIHAPETADRQHSFCARLHMIFVTPHPAEKLQYFFGVFLQFQIGVDTCNNGYFHIESPVQMSKSSPTIHSWMAGREESTSGR